MNLKIGPFDVGVAFFVSNDYSGQNGLSKLYGTHKVSDGLAKLFKEEFMYEVYQTRNASKAEFIDCCKFLAGYKYPQNCKRIVVFFSGHGDEGTLTFQDGKEKISINDMLQLFKLDIANNKTLVNVAKLFFIDACQGKYKDPDYRVTKSRAVPKSPAPASDINYNTVPTKENILIAYATSFEHIAFQNDKDGSRWAQCLIQALQNSKVEESVYSVLTATNKAMSTLESTDEGIQTPEFKSSLTVEIFFKKEALDAKRKEYCAMFTIFIQLCDKPITINVHGYTTIQQMRRMVEEKIGVEIGGLCSYGMELTHGDLYDWDICRNSTLTIVPVQVDRSWSTICGKDLSLVSAQQATAYKDLDSKYRQWCSALKHKTFELTHAAEIAILNWEVKDLVDIKDRYFLGGQRILYSMCAELQNDIANYFDGSQHSETIAPWKRAFVVDIELLKEKCLQDLQMQCKHFKHKRETVPQHLN